MKKRNGFVSNSSSSSFLLYGVEMEQNDFEEAAHEHMSEEDIKESEEDGYIDTWNLCGFKNSPFPNLNIENCESTYWIGLSWDTVGDDETGKEFKKRATEEVAKFLKKDPEEIECRTHEEAWRDG